MTILERVIIYLLLSKRVLLENGLGTNFGT
jgi:hypothetical protein